MPIIIVVGPDGSGKSTLCQELSNQFGMPIKSFSYPKTQEEKNEMFDMYIEEIENNDNVIYDRFAYCEWVYGPVMRDKTYISYEQLTYLEIMLLQKGAIIFYCYNEPRTLMERCKQRGENYIPLDKLKEIKERYDFLMKTLTHIIPIFNIEI